MVFPRGFVKLTVINTYSPSRDGSSRNKFSLLNSHNRHTSLLRNNFDGAHPCTIRNCIYETSIQPLKNLIFLYFFHCRIQSLLVLNNGFCIIFHELIPLMSSIHHAKAPIFVFNTSKRSFSISSSKQLRLSLA